ncbi:hypothetical protein K438DRAFT_1882132 [Mycena galopus ATCC 62051]|nr:hypothetical protein K438DRAFT_1882132 [Mycena galopus ATCC 62051]
MAIPFWTQHSKRRSNDPPSVADVIAAKKYAERTRTAAQYPNHIDDQTTANALVYENAILAAPSAGDASCLFSAAPPWFTAALDSGLRSIKTRLDAIEGRLDGFELQSHFGGRSAGTIQACVFPRWPSAVRK